MPRNSLDQIDRDGGYFEPFREISDEEDAESRRFVEALRKKLSTPVGIPPVAVRSGDTNAQRNTGSRKAGAGIFLNTTLVAPCESKASCPDAADIRRESPDPGISCTSPAETQDQCDSGTSSQQPKTQYRNQPEQALTCAAREVRGKCGAIRESREQPVPSERTVATGKLSTAAPLTTARGMAATVQEGTALKPVTSKCGEPTPIAGTIGDSRKDGTQH
jgi:hypothetical protein